MEFFIESWGFITSYWNEIEKYVKLILEIGVLTILIYYILYFLKGTRGFFVLAGIMISLSILTFMSSILELTVISWLLDGVWTVLVAALIVIFQPELRRGFALLGSGSTQFSKKNQRKQEAVGEVVQALINMSKNKIGALIVFEGNIGMQSIINDAIHISAKLNKQLLESIFFPNNPLHDGAIIIRGERIVAAHAILPLSHSSIFSESIGTRHRAGLGITEETDAVSVIVSEETGQISIASHNNLKKNIPYSDLLRILNKELDTNQESDAIKTFIEDISENKESGFTEGKDEE